MLYNNNFHIRVILRKKGTYELCYVLKRDEIGAQVCFVVGFIVVVVVVARCFHHHRHRRCVCTKVKKKTKNYIEDEMARGSICTISIYNIFSTYEMKCGRI